MIAVLMTGCINKSGNNSEDNGQNKNGSNFINSDSSDYIYTPEKILFPTLSSGIEYINNIVFFGEIVYFTANSNNIFSMNIDGTSLTKLQDYSTFTSSYNASINELIIDSNGFLWVIETVYLGIDIQNRLLVRKLNSAGSELLTLDISEYTTQTGGYIRQLNIDSDDNIYLGLEDSIIILDSSGKLLFTLDIMGWVNQIIRMPDGIVAHYDGRGVLSRIDAKNHGWEESIKLPFGVHNVLAGNDELPVLFTIGMTLYGIDAKTEESVFILDFLNSDLMFDILQNVSLLADERILISTYTSFGVLTAPVTEIIILTKTPYSERQNKELLTLAGINIDGIIRSAVVQFNSTSTTHRIHVTDYAVFNINADDTTGLTRLTTEITAGRVPDILALSGLPFRQYLARGLLADLNGFLDNDPLIKRNDLFESALKTAQADSELYRIFPAFNISTIVGNPEIIGHTPGWTMDEFEAVLYANPEADIPMGEEMTKELFLSLMLMHNMKQFVDWDLGEVFFDNSDFIQLLEFANRFSGEVNADIQLGIGAGSEMIASGRQIMVWSLFKDFLFYRIDRTLYGGEIIFKGFPGETNAGSIFYSVSDVGITSHSKNQDKAWEFVRLLLSEDFGCDNIHNVFPINRALFEERLAEAMIKDGLAIITPSGVQINIPEISPQEADSIRALIDSIAGISEHDEVIWNIVSEGASDFFNGRHTAQDAARIIQNRASIYMAERIG